jgi:hypothetical protein
MDGAGDVGGTSQTQKDKYHGFFFTCNLKKKMSMNKNGELFRKGTIWEGNSGRGKERARGGGYHRSTFYACKSHNENHFLKLQEFGGREHKGE